MASEEQKKLADFIKNVHISLRTRANEIGPEAAWSEHIRNRSVLQKYAENMKTLAEKFWHANNTSDAKCDTKCRVKWISDYCKRYFLKDRLTKLEAEKKKCVTIYGDSNKFDGRLENKYTDSREQLVLKLLDVGSCYDPFGKDSLFETYPIDLMPASSNVLQCDFLEVMIEGSILDCTMSSARKLPVSFFDVVIFSLFLEYLPSPRQRFKCCEKAYKCLKQEGLLVIVTPDSNHQSCNSKLMKQWRLSLQTLGFQRICLEKLKHLYCMAFRKAVCIADFKQTCIVSPEDMIIIPQDFHSYGNDSELNQKLSRSHSENEDVVECFNELPCENIDDT